MLQNAGYNTYYTGKLMNDHNRGNYNNPYPGGLNGSDFLVGPGKTAPSVNATVDG